MKCSRCGSENPDGSKFCIGCGNNLEVVSAPQENIQSPTSTVPQETVQQFVQPMQQPMYTQPVYNNQQMYGQPKKSHKGLIIGLSIGGVILLIIVLTVVFFVRGVKNAKWEWDDGVTIIDDGDSETGSSSNSKKKISDYEIADPVTLVDGSKWHVIGTKGDNLILLSDELAKEESGYGKSSSAEDQKYENSIIKEYLEDTYLPSLKSSLKAKGGDTDITVRLITMDEFLNGTGVKFITDECDAGTYSSDGSNYTLTSDRRFENYVGDIVTGQKAFSNMLSLTKNFWTMSNTGDRDCTNYNSYYTYYGAYYIEINDKFVGNYGSASLRHDKAAYGEILGGSGGGTSAGIRPVIETSLKNVK